MANPKKKITFNPITGVFDYVNSYDVDINGIKSALDVLFENDRTPSGNILAETPPDTRNYFMPVNLQSDNRYVFIWGGNTFTFLDCKNPYAIEQIKNITFNNAPGLFGQPQAATSIGDYIFVCTTNGKIHTIDWSNREDPIVASEATFSSGQHYDIATDGIDTLFLANVTNNLFLAIDASNPISLSLINTSGLSSFGAGVAYYGGYAYCANFGASQIHTYEFSGGTWNEIDITPSATNPSRLGVVSNIDNEVALVSNRYNGSSFALHSLANPANIGASNLINTPENINIYSRAFSVEGLLYINSSLGKIMVYNVRNLNNISLVGTYEPTYPDNTKRFSTILGGCSFTNKGAVPKKTTFMIVVGGNNIGPSTPANRDAVSLQLPLIPEDDKIRLLSTSKTIGGEGIYYEITSNGITVTLPAIPIKGDKFNIANFSTGNATIDGNGNNIMGLGLQTIYKDESFSLIYNETEWKVI